MLTAIEAAAFVYGCAAACCGGVLGVMVAVALEHSATNGALFDSRPHSVLDHPKPPRFRVLPRRDSLNPDMLVRVVARSKSHADQRSFRGRPVSSPRSNQYEPCGADQRPFRGRPVSSPRSNQCET